jgi:hypothetical protein
MVSAGGRRSGNAHSPVERRLIDSVARGDLLDLAGDEPVDEAAMRSWGRDRTVSASVVRDLVRGRLVAEPDPHGLRLRGARITGRIDLANIGGDLALELRDCLLPGGLDLRNARLPVVTVTGCRIEQAPDSGDAPVDATGLTSRVLSFAGSTVLAAAAGGAVRLAAARAGTVDCRGARLGNTAGPALDADGLQADHSVFLSDGFTATSTSGKGTVRLIGTRIGGQLNCGGASLTNTVGPALNADDLVVAHGVLLHRGFTAASAGEQGTIRLVGARLGALTAAGARLANTAGPAFDADSLRVDRDLVLGGGLAASGVSDVGTVVLTGAHVGGLLDCSAASMENTGGPALNANGLRVDQDAVLDDGFAATSARCPVVLALATARIGGTLRFDSEVVTRTAGDGGSLIEADGLAYSGLPRPASVQRWLTVLSKHTPAYAAQPYQHLAAAYRAAGHDRDARAVLIAQRRDQLRRGGATGPERAWGRLTGFTLGYGYQPWRALLLLVAVLASAAALAVVAGHHGALARRPATATAVACTITDQIGVGIDLGTPLIKTGSRDRCQPTDSATGQALTVAGWILQLLAWAFATLFVAGFTSAVRKT